MLSWKKQKDGGFVAAAGPFAIKAWPKGDGRWNWEIIVDNATNPAATGVATSAGAAKNACENYVQRSGRV